MLFPKGARFGDDTYRASEMTAIFFGLQAGDAGTEGRVGLSGIELGGLE
jgi:hypothetical protein